MAVLIISCSSIEIAQEIDHDIRNNRCEIAAEKIPDSLGYKIINKVKSTSGTVVSYLIKGTSYTTEFAIKYSAGVIATVIVCSPFVAAEVAVKGATHGTIMMPCFKVVGEGLVGDMDFKFSKKLSKDIRWMRCPDFNITADRVMSVSSCFEKRSDQNNLIKAEAHLLSLIKQRDFMKCIDDDKSATLWSALRDLHKEMNAKKYPVNLTYFERVEIKKVIKEKKRIYNKQRTIIEAVEKGENGMLHRIMEGPDDANLMDEEGMTVLMIAAKKGFYGTTLILLNQGADVTKKRYDNLDALFFAKLSKNPRVIRLIEERLRKAQMAP